MVVIIIMIIIIILQYTWFWSLLFTLIYIGIVPGITSELATGSIICDDVNLDGLVINLNEM